jgi:chaperonin GroES
MAYENYGSDVVGDEAEAPEQEQPAPGDSEKTGSYTVWQSIGQQDLTPFFSDEKLKEIGAQVVRDYDADYATSQEKRDRISELYKLAMQSREAKDYPFAGASNIKYPLLTKAAIGFASLAYPAIVQDDQVVKGKAVGKDDGDEEVTGLDGKPLLDEATGQPMRKNAGAKQRRANRVGTFMSHQLTEDMADWQDEMDKLLHIMPIIGGGFKKTYFEPIEAENHSDLVLPQYLVMDPAAKSVYTAQRVAEFYDLYPWEIEECIRLGAFRAFDYRDTSGETTQDKYRADAAGETPVISSFDESKPHLFVEMSLRLDLDGDEYPEPYVIWVHKDTSTVVRILPRFDRNGIRGDEAANMVHKIKAECQYTPFLFMPDPEGSPYGIGFGHLLQHLNEAANTSINQLIDAGHRYVMGGGFLGKGLRLKGGEMKFRPGEWKRVDSSGEDLRMNAMPLPMPEPSVVLFQLMEFLIKAADDITTFTAIVSGDIPANIAPTTMLASIEQNLQRFKAIFKRVHRSLGREFKRLFELNQKYLTQEAYMEVLDDDEAEVEADFNTSLVNVIPVSDPEMVNSTQQLIRAAALSEWKDDPLIDGIELRKRVFKAMNIPDADKLVKIPQQMPDELVEAQKAALAAQIESLNRDSERKDIELALKIEDAQPKRMKIIADAVKALAEAEATEDGPQVEDLKAQLDQMTQLNKKMEPFTNGKQAEAPAGPAQPGGDGGMETPPGDAAGAGLPAAQPVADGG